MSADLDLSRLEKAINELSLYSLRAFPDIVNRRALNVHGRWLNELPMASKENIQQQLGEIGRELRMTKKGKLVRTSKRIYSSQGAPLSALILNARRGRTGKKGLYGREMQQKITQMVGARRRSAGFGKSANIPGIKALAGATRSPFIIAKMAGISVRGQPKGEAIPAAKNSVDPKATIINSAKGISKFDAGALQRAISAEEREIVRHIEEDLKPGFQRFNAT